VRSGPWLRFDLGGGAFALPLESVAEVTAAPRPRLIPLVPLELAGVVRFRGEPLPVLDGGALLVARPLERSRHLIVLERGGLRLGMRVGEVSRIEADLRGAVDLDDGEPRPELADWVLFRGRPLGLLRPDELIARARELFQQRSEGGGASCHGAF
jgi:hypothetical protein